MNDVKDGPQLKHNQSSERASEPDVRRHFVLLRKQVVGVGGARVECVGKLVAHVLVTKGHAS